MHVEVDGGGDITGDPAHRQAVAGDTRLHGRGDRHVVEGDRATGAAHGEPDDTADVLAHVVLVAAGEAVAGGVVRGSVRILGASHPPVDGDQVPFGAGHQDALAGVRHPRHRRGVPRRAHHADLLDVDLQLGRGTAVDDDGPQAVRRGFLQPEPHLRDARQDGGEPRGHLHVTVLVPWRRVQEVPRPRRATDQASCGHGEVGGGVRGPPRVSVGEVRAEPHRVAFHMRGARQLHGDTVAPVQLRPRRPRPRHGGPREDAEVLPERLAGVLVGEAPTPRVDRVQHGAEVGAQRRGVLQVRRPARQAEPHRPVLRGHRRGQGTEVPAFPTELHIPCGLTGRPLVDAPLPQGRTVGEHDPGRCRVGCGEGDLEAHAMPPSRVSSPARSPGCRAPGSRSR